MRTIFFQVITQFLKLERVLDDNVDGEINLHIERGGTPLMIQLKVNFKFPLQGFAQYCWFYKFHLTAC